MVLGFHDLVDITIDAISNYSEKYYASAWFSGIEILMYNNIISNNSPIISSLKPYQLDAMKKLISMGYWITYDDDISLPCVRSLDYIFKDKVAIKNGAD